MQVQTRKWSTPLVIGSSVFVGISGMLMFFHLDSGLLKTAHEWIGIAFFIAMILHILNHWLPFKRYFKQQMGIGIISLVLLASAGFTLNSGSEPSPIRSMIQQIENSRVVDLAQLQQRPVAEIEQKLESQGLTLPDADMTLMEIAESNNVEPFQLVALLFNPPS